MLPLGVTDNLTRLALLAASRQFSMLGVRRGVAMVVAAVLVTVLVAVVEEDAAADETVVLLLLALLLAFVMPVSLLVLLMSPCDELK